MKICVLVLTVLLLITTWALYKITPYGWSTSDLKLVIVISWTCVGAAWVGWWKAFRFSLE